MISASVGVFIEPFYSFATQLHPYPLDKGDAAEGRLVQFTNERDDSENIS